MDQIEKEIFQRSELLFGSDKMNSLSQQRVIIFGIGGVGSWCAESLVRTGIRYITLVDSDRICVSNINRQLHATTKTVGEVKVDALKNRLLEINPTAEINAIHKVYKAETHDFFHLETYNFIVDAIDSLYSKIFLMRMATKTDAMFISSMGAALRIDPTRVKVEEFWQVKGCKLGAIMRKEVKKGELPSKKFMCVYSDELVECKGVNTADIAGSEQETNELCGKKAVTNGSVAHITGIFGFTIAGLITQAIISEKE